MTDSLARPRDSGTRSTVVGYRTEDHPGLDRAQNALSAGAAVGGGIAILLITGLTVVEVITRTLFAHPLGWNVGFVEQYLTVCLAFVGMVLAYRTGAHVAVEALYTRFGGRGRKVLMMIAQVLILLSMALLCAAGVEAAWYSLQLGESPPPGSADLSLPTWWWKALVPLGAALLFVVVSIDLYRELVSPWNEPASDYAAEERATLERGTT